jgi:hypothetical protein
MNDARPGVRPAATAPAPAVQQIELLPQLRELWRRGRLDSR